MYDNKNKLIITFCYFTTHTNINYMCYNITKIYLDI